MNPRAPLRFAVMISGYQLKSWQVECLKLLIGSDYARPVLVIRDSSLSEHSSFKSKWNKYLGKNGFYHAYERLCIHPPALRIESAEALLSDVETIDCLPVRKGRYSDYMPDGVLNRIRDVKPDFILRFAFNILKGEVLEIPKYGVWSYHHADEKVFRGGPAAFWEIFHAHHKIGVVLQRLTERIDGGHILKKGWYKVAKHSYSETLNRVLDESVSWPSDICREIVHERMDTASIPASNSEAVMNRLPSNVKMVQFAFRWFIARLRFYWHTYFHVEEWNVGLVHQSLVHTLKAGISKEPRWLFKTNRKWFAADPALLTTMNSEHLLFEFFKQRKGLGAIHQARINEGGIDPSHIPLLEREHHLAFPRILETGGKKCLYHDASQQGFIGTYPIEAGDSVSLAKSETIFPRAAVDPAIIYHKDHWYLFCTFKEADTNTALHIFHSDSIQGDWMPHAGNPVKVDVSSARMAGPLIRIEEDLFRPAQDSASHYGSQIRMHRINILTPEQFEEEEVRVFEPGRHWKYNHGLHTIDGNERITVVDAKRYRFSFFPLWKRLRLL